MKQVIFAALASLTMIHPTIAGGASPAEVRVSMEFLKNDFSIWQQDLALVDGVATPVSHVTRLGVIQECTSVPGGEPVLKPDVITYGILASVTPSAITYDGAQLNIAFDYSELESITSKRDDHGCSIQIPRLRGLKTSANISLKDGESVTLPTDDGPDKYALIFRKYTVINAL